MKEGTASNINYNILYCLFLPTSLYYSLFLINDNLSNLFLLLTLLSATSLFAQRQHQILHITIAFIAVLDFIIKILLHTGIVTSVLNVDLDLSLMAKIFEIANN